MERIDLIGLGGLAVMVGSAVFALGLFLRTWLIPLPIVEVITSSMFLLLLVVFGIAMVAVTTLLRRTRYGKVAALASIGFLVGVVVTFVGLFTLDIQSSGGAIPLFIGMLMLAAALGVFGVLTVVANVLRWWGSVSLVVGTLLLFLAFGFGFFPLSMHWLIGLPWIIVGYAIFQAAMHQTEQPSRVR